jgi:hypothetical protein
LIRTQPATVSADPSALTGDVTEIVADPEGKLPGQVWDSNAAAPVANTEDAARTTNPQIIAFLPPTKAAILKMDLTRDEQSRCVRVVEILPAPTGKSKPLLHFGCHRI